MPAWFNEIDAYPAQWTRNLIAAGLVAPGVVDERSIEDLTAADVAGPGQRHFFAGIAGWSLGLRLAGVPDHASIWTGSCPCQSLSVAGLQRGAFDPRHLWPAWYRLIAECRPPVILGEQASGTAGRAWLTAVRHDLEGLGYAVGAADLAAASVSAPHIRQRHFFGAVLGVGLADTDTSRWLVEWRRRVLDGERAALGHDVDGRSPAGDGLGVGVGVGHAARVAARPAQGPARGAGANGRRMGEPIRHDAGRHPGAGPGQEAEGVGQRGNAGRVGDLAGSPGDDGHGMGHGEEVGRGTGRSGGAFGRTPLQPAGPGDDRGPWADTVLVECRDPKRGTIYRPAPTDPAIPVVAPRVPGDCPRLRAGGNAVVPQVVAAFVASFLEAVTDTLL